uniref:Putative serine/threonine-protein kinase clka n=1 Tax=Nyssomyia neivai TaxID=330878 RepID=A0A1L8DKK1_9DIPT
MIVKSLLGIFIGILLLSTTEQAPARRKDRPMFSDRVEKFLKSMTNDGLNDRDKITYLGEILSALSYYKYNDPNYLEHCVGQKIIQDGYRDVQRYGDHQQGNRDRNRNRYGNNPRVNAQSNTNHDNYDYNEHDDDTQSYRDQQRDNQYSGRNNSPGNERYNDEHRGTSRVIDHDDRGTQTNAQTNDDYDYNDYDNDHNGDRSQSWYNDNPRGTSNTPQDHASNNAADDDYDYNENNRDRTRDQTRDRTANAPISNPSRGSQIRGIDGHGVTEANDHDVYDEYDENENSDQDQPEDLHHHENYDYYDEEEEEDHADDDHMNQEQSIDGHNPRGSQNPWDRTNERGSQRNQMNDQSGKSREVSGSSRGTNDRTNYGYDPHDTSKNSQGRNQGRNQQDHYGGYNQKNHRNSNQNHYGQQYNHHGIHGEPYVPYGQQSPYITGDAVPEHSGDYDHSQYDPHLVEDYLNRIHLQGVPSDLAEYANSYLQYAKDTIRASASHAKNFENIRPCLEHLAQYFNILTDDLANEYRRCSNKCYYNRLESFSTSVSQYTSTTNECIQNRLY